MNLDKNFDISQGLQRVQCFDAELASEPCLGLKSEEAPRKGTPVSSSVDWACSTVRLGLNAALEQERLQRLEGELIDRLIEGYEHAVEEGLPPNRAIASMLEWVSRECPRLVP
jgi:hypothetical protein